MFNRYMCYNKEENVKTNFVAMEDGRDDPLWACCEPLGVSGWQGAAEGRTRVPISPTSQQTQPWPLGPLELQSTFLPLV